ncbi:MAG: tRNA (adenosine(37)-N6)-threonylcarbamoyltransferase complex ATPase subunit type 1 TsaE [Elusimicrobiota bacterium]
MNILSRNEEQTLAFAAKLAKAVKPGVICLSGPLGAGKTTFVRGFLRGLGYRGAVRSPTFALVHEYPRVKPRVYHLDLYRIEDSGELDGMGLEDCLSDVGAVSLIEWPEIAAGRLPARRVDISFAHARGGGRSLRLRRRRR